jgi:hypothetical protein
LPFQHHQQKHQHGERPVQVEQHAPQLREDHVELVEIPGDQHIGCEGQLIEEEDQQPGHLPPLDAAARCQRDNHDDHAYAQRDAQNPKKSQRVHS